jgi:hypothetical protein
VAALSVGGALIASPWLRLRTPLIEPDLHHPHPALGQDFTPSPRPRRAQAGSAVRARSTRGRARRSPGSRAGDVSTCQGLRRPAAGPALATARRSMLPSAFSRASALRTEFTPLNGWPARIPVNASRTALRPPAHDSGAVWFARPSLLWTCTTHLLPVSRRTE